MLLLEADYAEHQPFEVHLTLQVLDGRGGGLSTTTFPAGKAVHILEAALVGEFLKVHSISTFGSRIGSFVQYYALADDRPVLVRIETGQGRLRPNRYAAGQPAFGPGPAGRPASAWADDLASSDRVRRLAALAWLGGRHEPEPPEAGRHPDVVQAVAALRLSEDAWIREAALAVPLP